MSVILYAATIFLSAFLLFQVQPLIARIILPWFGGTAAVWTVCMLFFQVVLLAGYVYSHAYIQLRMRARRLLHVGLLVLAVATLPLAASSAWKPAGGDDPTWPIFGLLATSVGLPYFMLSTTGPLLQAWYARSHQGTAPYRLFALSNLGSMLALISYPLLVEPWLLLGQQAKGWSAGFVLFASLCGGLAWRSREADASLPPKESARRPGLGLKALWAGLAACASMLLLAFTSHMTLNIAAIPFLWVVPLALYLLSFVLCFEASGWYRRWLFLPLLAAGFAAVSVTLSQSNPSIWTLIPLYSATLFAACMVCHGELARSKPDPRYLTSFYLMLAVGGALGGVLVGLVAPNVFDDLYELPIGMLALCVLVFAALYADPSGVLRGRGGRIAQFVLAGLTAALAVALAHDYRLNSADSRLSSRNFYGVLRVRDSGEGPEAMRTLAHGTIIHGKQFLDPDRRDWPTTYYGKESGVALAISDEGERGPVKVGVVGLGAGTLAAYGRPGDVYRFYDINPRVVEIAGSEFSFLADSKARVEIALGDARLSLEREPAQNFDVLALDAFSSDAIPIHLLTAEAFGAYLRHLAPGGILAVHISNRYLDLVPVVQEAARHHALELRQVANDDDEDGGVYRSDWMLLSASPSAFEGTLLKDAAGRVESVPRVRLWTDDYSDLSRILK
ncbi:MAG TPA: fused MFS/spermidine synthase [Burkholderiales bacterium]|nr:fused MFS/spermidine synthase [Burkholderiales bacterium]